MIKLLMEWLRLAYQVVKDFYDIYMMFMVIAIGIFNLFIDYKSLEKRKLKKEVKVCRAIGAVYIVGGIGLYVFTRIF